MHAGRSEATIGTVIDVLSRLEYKVDDISTYLSHVASTSAPRMVHAELESPFRVQVNEDLRAIPSPHSTRHTANTPGSSTLLSFSAHKKIQWPGIKALLPLKMSQQYPDSYPAHLELTRPQFTVASAQRLGPDDDWLSTLSLATVKELCNAYFDTFNRIYPLLDRDHFFLQTLGHVVRQGFDEDPETCLVLAVMALGVLGLKAYADGGFFVPTQRRQTGSGLLNEPQEFARTLTSEALRRSGSCLISHDLQSCQYYMVSAVFFLQTMRPADMWLMLSRGAALLTTLLQYPPDDDGWAADVRSRVFWTSVALEVVVVQEFEYSPSRLREWEDITPLPKFIPYPHVESSRMRDSRPDDSHYQYHFLAQVAHRIILSRIREELFNSNPSVAVATELRHQLEQWSVNLPIPVLERTVFEHKDSFSCPADAATAALLRTRYCVGIYHLGRPFCFRAIHQPDVITDAELAICAEALQMSNEWPLASELMMAMSTFMPLQLFCSGQMLGQLLIMYAFQHSPDPRVRAAVPAHHRETCEMILRYMASLKDESPTVAMDYELACSLYDWALPD